MNRTKIRSLHSVLNLRLIASLLIAFLSLTQPLNAYVTPNPEAAALHKLLNNSNLESRFLDAAYKHKLDPVLLASIAMLESNMNNSAINLKTHDFCMLQINHKTAKSLNLNIKKLRSDVKYCINSGAKILSWFKRTYQNKEPHTWTCRYNVGTRLSPSSRACLAYLKKLDAIQSTVKLEVPNA